MRLALFIVDECMFLVQYATVLCLRVFQSGILFTCKLKSFKYGHVF